MLVLVLNAGSSSIKYQIIDMKNEKIIAKGLCERISVDGRVTHQAKGIKHVFDIKLKNHNDALEKVVELLTVGENAVISDINDIKAIGHRISVGGEKYIEPKAIDGEVLSFIKSIVPIAPLHTPAMIDCINASETVFPKALKVAVFDTAFHHTIPEKAYIYPVPYEYYEKHGLRKFGYHGSSFKYVLSRLCELYGNSVYNKKMVICHIGNGSSITAVKNGKSVDTTMGYTPLDGVIMGTRCGTIDPSVIFRIAEYENLNLNQVEDILNRKSGYLGISGLSSDDRDLTKAAEEGDKRASLAREILFYQLKKYIGAYAAVMNGLDFIIFTGGIGEKASDLRSSVLSNMSYFKVKLDENANVELNGKEGEISAPDSEVKVLIVPTNEELMIARDTVMVYTTRQ